MTELDTCKFADIKEDDVDTFSNSFTGIENCAYGTAKTNSLPANATIAYWNNENIDSAIQVPPELLASQLTLLDFPIFASIQLEELSSCAWTKKNKATIAPNVVAFTRRFNQVSFWTVEEILKGSSAKQRAEILTHFIKVAKKLYELKNINSLFAIISALQTASIYRLSQTWATISKKEKHTFDKLAQFFSDDNNWFNLREYIAAAKLPCIPYLGIFLTDLVYIDMAHITDLSNRSMKMNEILTCIQIYQKSDFSHIRPDTIVQEYLKGVRYIEELQKFHEDDQYKLSLKLEPPSNANSACSSIESMRAKKPEPLSSSFSLSHPSVTNSIISISSLLGHRRCISLGSRFRSSSLPRNFHKMTGITGSHFHKDESFENVVLRRGLNTQVNLLDDTSFENNACCSQRCASTLNSFSNIAETYPSDWNDCFQGPIKRKTLLKDNQKLSLSSWQRYWILIWANSLVYFSPKPFKTMFTCSKSNYKEQPSKIHLLEDWTVSCKENSDTFYLSNMKIGCTYKFKVDDYEHALKWTELLKNAICQFQKPLPTNLMSFE